MTGAASAFDQTLADSKATWDFDDLDVLFLKREPICGSRANIPIDTLAVP
jgi:hypothetical protein